MKATVECPGCKRTIKFHRQELMHYRHDVDGNNVYVTCNKCLLNVTVSKIAIDMGWVPAQ